MVTIATIASLHDSAPWSTVQVRQRSFSPSSQIIKVVQNMSSVHTVRDIINSECSKCCLLVFKKAPSHLLHWFSLC